jgi:hypothetical protein
MATGGEYAERILIAPKRYHRGRLLQPASAACFVLIKKSFCFTEKRRKSVSKSAAARRHTAFFGGMDSPGEQRFEAYDIRQACDFVFIT